jgi:abhydrolase domain-containing protein 17
MMRFRSWWQRGTLEFDARLVTAVETWKLLRVPLAVLGTGYVCFAALAPTIAQRLLYYPQFGSTRAPEGLRKIRGEAGELAVLYLPNPGARFTLWYFHGNAEDLGDIEPRLRDFREAGFSVFAVEYPGYGHSAGQPSESAIYAAIATARDYLRNELKVPAEQTILYGHSLGGGPALQLALEERQGGVVLQSTFTSAFRVMTRWPVLPFDQYQNIRKLPRVSCPVLILHGTNDEVISFHHGEALFAAALEPKRAMWMPGAGHNDLREVAGKKFWDALTEFRDLCARSSGAKG